MPKKVKILVVMGTRSEAIKLAPVIMELRRHQDGIQTVVCATGQHREMLQQALKPFGLHPDFNLDVMTANQSLADVTSAVLKGMDSVLEREKPDMVLVQGDTTTTWQDPWRLSTGESRWDTSKQDCVPEIGTILSPRRSIAV